MLRRLSPGCSSLIPLKTRVATLCLVFGLSVALNAFSVVPISIEALAREADLVVHGTVLSKTCQQDPVGRIYTRVELAVSDVWKGAISGTPLIIVHGGGVLGERQTMVSGQVNYDVGEEVVVFLVRNQRSEGVTLSLMQGKFHVWAEREGGVRFAANPFHGLPEAGARSVGQSENGPMAKAAALKLADLKQRVQEAAR
jgi:hypothetical protein